MKNLAFVSITVLILFAAASAQSGRRIKSAAPVPASTPEVSTTNDVHEVAAPSVGYSESAPNSARSISPREVSKKKSKSAAKGAETQQPAPAPGAPPAVAGEEDVVKGETNLVTVPVTVADRGGNYISNLNKSDFKIFEDGKEQEVAYFATSEVPFTVILLIDVSPSTAYKIEEIQQAAIAFVNQLKPTDSVMVIQFDRSVRVLTELTTDRQQIAKAIRR